MHERYIPHLLAQVKEHVVDGGQIIRAKAMRKNLKERLGDAVSILAQILGQLVSCEATQITAQVVGLCHSLAEGTHFLHHCCHGVLSQEVPISTHCLQILLRHLGLLDPPLYLPRADD